MGLKLPLYLVAGEKLISVLPSEEGGLSIRGWDFRKREMTRDAVEWDEIVGHLQEGRKVQGSSDFAEGEDTFEITREEFDQRLAELQGGALAPRQPGVKAIERPGPPEPLTQRRTAGRGEVEVSNLERSIREGAAEILGGECCEGPAGEPPEDQEKLREAVKKIYGDDAPTR